VLVKASKHQLTPFKGVNFTPMYRIVFDRTGDEIPFVPVNLELLEFYLEQLDQQNLNNFWPCKSDLAKIIFVKLQKLKDSVLEINTWLNDLANFEIEVLDNEQYLDQRVLNKMHAEWVRSQNLIYDIQKKRLQLNFSSLAEKIHEMFPDDIQTPPLAVVIEKLGLKETYNSLNEPHIHSLELMFNRIKFTVSDTWTKIADNPFDKKLLTNNQANLSISFNHLGRTLYNKFLNFDTTLEFDDENSFDELLGYVTLSLQPSQTIPFSSEYIAWCKSNNREPIGDNLNIGNIPNLSENLTKYRTIVFRNLLSNNKFSIRKG
jgi:hypothetical protein